MVQVPYYEHALQYLIAFQSQKTVSTMAKLDVTHLSFAGGL
jgi:hypothetical protein